MHIYRLLKQIPKRLIVISRSVLILTVIAYVMPATAATNTHATYKNGILTITKPDGQILEINSTGDLDNDGIADTLEINGFTYDRDNGLQPWNGDSGVEYFRTDPDRWSTDGDPYSDWMEVSGVQMPSYVKKPVNHPLVAARPVITVGMSSYVVTPIETITTSSGGEQSGSFTNETSSTTERGTDVEASAGWSAKDGLSFGASVSKSYSQSWSRTNSSTSSIASNWETARTADPSNAAKLKLNVYMKNIGSATAYDVIPTFNLVLGNKTIATITPESKSESLAPGDRYPANEGTFAVPEANASYEIILTLDELKAIQLGAPLGLVVIQVAANVARWDATQNLWFIDKPWSVFENEIDPVVVNLQANLGNGDIFNYQVYIGTEYYDLGLTFEDVLSLVFDVDNTSGSSLINGRKYPDNWFVSTTSDSVKDEWNRRSRPESLLDFKMFSDTYMIMTSPGDDPEADVNMAIFSPDYRYVYASAFSRNFPIVSVKARVKINDVYQEVELSDIDSLGREIGLFSNDKQFMYVTDPTGEVIVENAAGDITTVPIFRPKFYSNAEDIKANSSFLPNPGDNYFIALQGDSTKIVQLYCQFFDLETGDTLKFPKEYLTLPVHAYDANYLDWYIDGQSPGRVYFDKIRIWADELQVIGWDLTWTHGDIPENWADDVGLTSVSFGSIRLNGDFADSASANIDLTGTPYSLGPDTEFEYGLYGQAYSSIFIDASRQIAQIKAIKPQDETWDATRYAGMQPYRFNLIYKREADLEKVTFASSVKSVQFDQEGFVNMGENGPELSKNTTMEAWINPSSYVSENGESAYILGKEKKYSISVPADGTIQLGLAFDENTWKTYNMHYQTVPGEWIHVAYTFAFDAVEGYTVRGYINGNLFHEFKINGFGELLGDGNPGSFTIGSRFWNEDSPYYSAGVDELRFWSVVRTQEEIQSTMTDTLGSAIYSTDQSGLTGYWRFDEVEDLGINYVQGGGADGNDDVRDLSVNGQHGDLSEFGAGLTASTVTAVDLKNADNTILVHDFSLNQNYPNPFNPTTTIDFSIARAGQVNLTIFNVRGQEMATLVNEQLAPGSYKAQLDARSWPSGIYFYQLTAGEQKIVNRMILMK